MENNKKSSSNTSFVKGFLLGGIVGAVFAFLYAPKSGKELREDIKKRSAELKTEAEKKIGDAKEIASKIIEDGLKKAEELQKQADEKIREAHEKAAEILSKSDEKLDSVKKDVEDKIKKAGEKAEKIAEQGRQSLKKKTIKSKETMGNSSEEQSDKQA